jgi:hypothetical protein
VKLLAETSGSRVDTRLSWLGFYGRLDHNRLSQNCAKTVSVVSAGVVLEREADSPSYCKCTILNVRDRAIGGASAASHAGGHRFESCRAHHHTSSFQRHAAPAVAAVAPLTPCVAGILSTKRPFCPLNVHCRVLSTDAGSPPRLLGWLPPASGPLPPLPVGARGLFPSRGRRGAVSDARNGWSEILTRTCARKGAHARHPATAGGRTDHRGGVEARASANGRGQKITGIQPTKANNRGKRRFSEIRGPSVGTLVQNVTDGRCLEIADAADALNPEAGVPKSVPMAARLMPFAQMAHGLMSRCRQLLGWTGCCSCIWRRRVTRQQVWIPNPRKRDPATRRIARMASMIRSGHSVLL